VKHKEQHRSQTNSHSVLINEAATKWQFEMIYRRRLSMLSPHGSLLSHGNTARNDERKREKRNTMTL